MQKYSSIWYFPTVNEVGVIYAELLLAMECLKERLYDTTMLATTPGINPGGKQLS